jgi:hypothetical protein
MGWLAHLRLLCRALGVAVDELGRRHLCHSIVAVVPSGAFLSAHPLDLELGSCFCCRYPNHSIVFASHGVGRLIGVLLCFHAAHLCK